MKGWQNVLYKIFFPEKKLIFLKVIVINNKLVKVHKRLHLDFDAVCICYRGDYPE